MGKSQRPAENSKTEVVRKPGWVGLCIQPYKIVQRADASTLQLSETKVYSKFELQTAENNKQLIYLLQTEINLL